jgi:nucleoside-diphosphate-sugar epimerase
VLRYFSVYGPATARHGVSQVHPAMLANEPLTVNGDGQQVRGTPTSMIA